MLETIVGLIPFLSGDMDEKEVLRLRLLNNPKNKPIGPHTGRCGRCAGDDLWDDETAYGCNGCHAVYSFTPRSENYV